MYIYAPNVQVIGYTGSPTPNASFAYISTFKGLMVKNITKLGGNQFYSSPIKYVIINQDSIPELIANSSYIPRFYVPDKLMQTYIETYPSYEPRIFPLSQFKTDFPEETYWDDKW